MIHRISLVTLILVLITSSAQAQNTRIPSDSRAQDNRPQLAILDSAVSAITQMHMDQFSDSILWEAAIDGLIEALQDPYAELFTPVESEAWEEETTGNYSGIGLQITQLNERITVTAVFRSTPANQAGLLAVSYTHLTLPTKCSV